jgi:hypothetical protein
MRREIGRQQEDLEVLLKGTPFPATVEELRAKSTGTSVLGEFWYGDASSQS